ncbi:MAG TPA: DUF1062 domain-containing protein [Acidimicrobiales bacterium]|nr:DUF1062 domain-containing protein [Acidimicrobiales bacterium]
MLHRFTVTSVALPTIRTHCRSCRDTRRFACRERFRANGNGKLVDIWLLYACTHCDATRNVTVVERTAVRKVARPLLDAAYDNDVAVARRMARDVSMLRRAGVGVDTGDEWQVTPSTGCACDRLVLELPEPLLVRLDAVVASALEVPRSVARDSVGVIGGGSGRLDALRLWGTVELRRLRE